MFQALNVTATTYRYRTSKEKFPIIVTQDCGHEETSNAIQAYARHIYKHIKVGVMHTLPFIQLLSSYVHCHMCEIYTIIVPAYFRKLFV